MTKRKPYIPLAAFITVLFFSACKSTHFVPEEKFLLSKNEVKIKGDYSFDPEELETYVKQKPNSTIFFGTWKFYLTAYNFLHKKKDDTEEFQMKKHGLYTRVRLKSKEAIGEAPVVMDTTKIPYSVKQMQTYLQNKGYYHSSISYEIKYPTKKKARVAYNVILNKPYVINQIKAKSDDSFILSSYHEFAESSPLQPGKLFDAGLLNAERLRLTELYQNEGLFDFNEYFIHFRADTTIGNNKVNVTLIIDNPAIKRNQNDSLLTTKHKRYKIRDIFVQTDFNPLNPNLPSTDSILIDGMYTFIYRDTLHYRPTPLIKAIYFKNGDYYKIRNHNQTYRQLTDLGIFNFIKIDYRRIETDTSSPKMDVLIKLSPKKKHSISFEGQATFREGFGGGGIIIFKTKNPFKGLEQIEFNIRGFAESVKNTATNERIIGTDIGPQISMKIPSLLFFPKLSKSLWREAYPKTVLSTYFNYQNRKEYQRWVYSFSNTYEMNESSWKTHRLSLPELSLSYIDKNSIILDSLSKLSPRLAFSFQNYVNAGIKYSYTFNGQLRREKNPSFLMANINITGLLGSFLKNTGIFSKDASGAQLLAGIRYSKFVKVDGDYRKYFNLHKEEQIILRSYAGLAVPFGKGDIAVPFDKLFYSGGANGIRGWKVRTLGPGSSQDSTSIAIDKLGEIKLELNAEYRFRINDMLKGAVFTDAGNVWRLQDTDEKAVFRLNRFYKEIAVASGIGLRFDLSFLIARFDVGWPIHKPYMGNTWEFRLNEAEFNVGIGYPF